MSAEVEAFSDFEIAHVLCIDIVGYSKLMTDEQSERLGTLNALVRQTEQFSQAEAAKKLILLPTGDGIVLVFFTTPQAPVECAVQLAQALRAFPEIPLRMGVHSGPINRVRDVNHKLNVAGAGINIGQRVMDCGDAGHILLSKRVAEDLAHFRRWRPHLNELGGCEVKHGVKIEVVNLCMGEVGNAAVPQKFLSKKSAPARKSMNQKFVLAAITLLVLLAAGFGFWKFARPKSIGPATATQIDSLAVKPLENLSGDESKEYFADGMTDELTTKLSQINALKRVVSRSTMMQYKRSPKSSAEIAREMNVGAMLEGAVVLSGNQARISVQLVDAGTEKTLWAQSYTQDLANIVQLQDRVTVEIANAIALKLTPGERTRLATARAVNPEAYQYYLRAKTEPQVTRESNDVAIGLLQKAVALDEHFAQAFAALATAYSGKSYFFEADKEWTTRAEEAAAKALELDPALPDALETRAELLWTPAHRFPHEEVITMARHGLAIAPNFSDLHEFLGGTYFHVGLIDEATAEYESLQRIAPGQAARFHLGLMELYRTHYKEAQDAIEKNPQGMVPSFVQYQLSLTLFYQGKIKEARAVIDQAKEKLPDESGVVTAQQGFFLAAAGDTVHAHEKIEEAIKVGENFGHFHHTAYAIATTYAALNENADALKWLRFAAENGFPNLTWFERDPALDSLRKDPGYVALINEMRPRFEKLKALADASPETASN